MLIQSPMSEQGHASHITDSEDADGFALFITVY